MNDKTTGLSVSKKMVHIHLSNSIRLARELSGLTQVGLAKRSGMTRSKLAMIETGRQEVSIYDAFCLARALNVRVSSIIPSMDEVLG